MEGNASAYKINPECRITSEGRAVFLRTWGAGFDQEERGRGGVGRKGYKKKIHI